MSDTIRNLEIIGSAPPWVPGPIQKVVVKGLSGGTGGSSLPSGALVMYAGNEALTEPDGWLLCDGQAVSRTTYADLFTAISTTYGVGDGSTTFNVPDFRGRSPLGVNNTNLPNSNDATLTTRNRATKTGTETHTLTESEIPAHDHTITDAGHTHTVTDPTHSHGITDPGHFHSTLAGAIDAGGASAVVHDDQTHDGGTVATDSKTTGITIGSKETGITIDSKVTGITVDNAGSGNAHANVHPVLVINFLIKT